MANTFYKVNSILEMTLPPSPKKIHEICLQMLSYVDKQCPGISLEFLHDVEGTSLVDLLAERVLEMNGTEQNIHRNHADTTWYGTKTCYDSLADLLFVHNVMQLDDIEVLKGVSVNDVKKKQLLFSFFGLRDSLLLYRLYFVQTSGDSFPGFQKSSCLQHWNVGFLMLFGQVVDLNMGVSKNRGTPKSSISIGCSIINHPFWGTPIFGNTHIMTRWLFERLQFHEQTDDVNSTAKCLSLACWRIDNTYV